MEKKIANLRKEATVCCLQKVNESLQEAVEGGGMGWDGVGADQNGGSLLY